MMNKIAMTGLMVLGLAACSKKEESKPVEAAKPVETAKPAEPKAADEAKAAEANKPSDEGNQAEGAKLVIDWDNLPAFDMAAFKGTDKKVSLAELHAAVKAVVEKCTFSGTENSITALGCQEFEDVQLIRFGHFPENTEQHYLNQLGHVLLTRPEASARTFGAQLSSGVIWEEDHASRLAPLIKATEAETDPVAMAALLEALGTTDSLTPEVLAVVTKALGHEQDFVRAHALASLRKLDARPHLLTAQHLEPVVAMAKNDANIQVRGKACQLIGQAALPGAKETLESILEGRVSTAPEAGACLGGMIELWWQPYYANFKPNAEAFTATLKYLPELGQNQDGEAHLALHPLQYGSASEGLPAWMEANKSWFLEPILSKILSDLVNGTGNNSGVRSAAISSLANFNRKDLLEKLAETHKDDESISWTLNNTISRLSSE